MECIGVVVMVSTMILEYLPAHNQYGRQVYRHRAVDDKLIESSGVNG